MEERLKVLQEGNALLVARGQDLEGQVQAAEQKAEETEGRVREVVARLEESERQVHNAEQRATQAANNVGPFPLDVQPHLTPPP